MPAYASAYLRAGRVYAPVDPFVLRVADRMWFDRSALVVEREGRRIRIPLQPGFTEELAIGYVPVGVILRALGDRVAYDAAGHLLDVRTWPPGAKPAITPTPFQPGAEAQVLPRGVFTPQPVATPKPVWSGTPLPRRTPLPAGSP